MISANDHENDSSSDSSSAFYYSGDTDDSSDFENSSDTDDSSDTDIVSSKYENWAEASLSFNVSLNDMEWI